MSGQLHLTEFQQKYAFTLAHARMVDLLARRPDLDYNLICAQFADFVEGAIEAAVTFDSESPVDPELLA